jgi:hypothetical protein
MKKIIETIDEFAFPIIMAVFGLTMGWPVISRIL